MSKIVMLSAQLAAPAVLSDLFSQIARQDLSLANSLKNMDLLAVIRECAGKALNEVVSSSPIKLEKSIADFYGNRQSQIDGFPLIGALKTSRLPNGLGVMVDATGTVKFAADTFKTEWQNEANRLKKLFGDALRAQLINSAMQILGYEVKIAAQKTSGETVYQLECERAGQ